MFSAFLKVLCPQKISNQISDKVGSSWGRAQSFSLGNNQSFHLLISAESLLSVDLKSPVDNTSQQILSYKWYNMFKIDDLLLCKDAKISYTILILLSGCFSLCSVIPAVTNCRFISCFNWCKNRFTFLVPPPSAVVSSVRELNSRSIAQFLGLRWFKAVCAQQPVLYSEVICLYGKCALFLSLPSFLLENIL